jgi:glycosyltransferase involved in cell wall biosynthesis
MTRITFLLSKDPVTERGGDLDTSRAVMRLAAESFEVSAICLSAEAPGTTLTNLAPGGLALTRVPKPPLKMLALLRDSVRSGRSPVHTRFDVDSLLPAIESCDADVFVAEHSYMAETFIRSAKFGVRPLVVNTINTESQVWRSTRGAIGRALWRVILRDEVRVARAADAVGVYDAEEADFYREHGVPNARWLDLTTPPADRLDIAATPRRLVFLGTREWPPNQEGFLEALRLWPQISAGIPDAELCLVGNKKPGSRDPAYPSGVRDLGFVADLDGFLRTCRALMAPIRTGGGVRAKLLDAASRGLPVVATSAAIGSLGPLFELSAHDAPADFVAECRRYLLDEGAAAAAGRRLFELNERHWSVDGPRRSIEDLFNTAVRA